MTESEVRKLLRQMKELDWIRKLLSGTFTT